MSNSRMNNHLTTKHLTDLKDKVMAEVERIENKLMTERLMAVNQNSGRDEVDSANDEIIQREELRFATRETFYLKKLRKAMKHMDSDEYGLCDDCGTSISFQRLEARPTSTMCITCKEESERDELQSFHGRQSKSLGKTVSLSK
jgi:DnaK suppressor protein